MGIPIGQGIFSVRAGRLQDLIPEGVISLMGIKVRVEEFGPDGTRDSSDEPRRLRAIMPSIYSFKAWLWAFCWAKIFLVSMPLKSLGLAEMSSGRPLFYGSNGG